MLDLQVQPLIAAARRRVHFAASVTSSGSTTVEARLSASGADAAMLATITPGRLLLDPGQTRTVDVSLRARRPRFAGDELSRTVLIRARGDDAGPVAAAREVVFVQQRALPAWAFVLTIVLVAAAAVAVTQLPDRVSVPQVQGAPDVATAERTLRAAGLELDPQLRSRAAGSARPGTILDQIPGPGVRASRGDRVTLLVALGAGRAVTPELAGQTPARARALLRAAGLTLGPILPGGAAAVRVSDLRSGRSAREAAPPQGNAVEPSWSSDGRRLLYRVGRRLLLVPPSPLQ